MVYLNMVLLCHLYTVFFITPVEANDGTVTHPSLPSCFARKRRNCPVMHCVKIKVQHVARKVCVLIKVASIFSFIFHNI